MGQKFKNAFSKGLITDLHPDVVDNQTLSGGQNIQFLDNDSNQMIAQKIDGQVEVSGAEKSDPGMPDNLRILASKSFNNINYLVTKDINTGEVELGTIPGILMGTSSEEPSTITRTSVDVDRTDMDLDPYVVVNDSANALGFVASTTITTTGDGSNTEKFYISWDLPSNITVDNNNFYVIAGNSVECRFTITPDPNIELGTEVTTVIPMNGFVYPMSNTLVEMGSFTVRYTTITEEEKLKVNMWYQDGSYSQIEMDIVAGVVNGSLYSSVLFIDDAIPGTLTSGISGGVDNILIGGLDKTVSTFDVGYTGTITSQDKLSIFLNIPALPDNEEYITIDLRETAEENVVYSLLTKINTFIGVDNEYSHGSYPNSLLIGGNFSRVATTCDVVYIGTNLGTVTNRIGTSVSVGSFISLEEATGNLEVKGSIIFEENLDNPGSYDIYTTLTDVSSDIYEIQLLFNGQI